MRHVSLREGKSVPCLRPKLSPAVSLLSVWHLRGQVKPILVLCVKGIDQGKTSFSPSDLYSSEVDGIRQSSCGLVCPDILTCLHVFTPVCSSPRDVL